MTEDPKETRYTPELNHTDLLIRAEQVKLLYKNAPVSMIASFINPCILVLILWNVVNHGYLLAWAAGIILITTLRYSDVIRFQRASPDPSRALSRFTFGNFLSGIAWGSAGILLFPAESLIHETFLIFLLGGMVIGAAGAYSAVKRAFFSFCIPAVSPIIVRFLLIGDANHTAMAGLSLLFTVLVSAMAMYMHNLSANSLRIRFEKKTLISYLEAAKADAEKLTRDLVREIDIRKKTEEQLNQHRQHLQEMVDASNTELLSANEQLRKEIRERLRAEKALRQSEAYFRSLIENTLDLITVADREGNILYLNPAIESLLGYRQEELYHMHILDLVHPEDKKSVHEAFSRITQRSGNIESLIIRIQHINGSWHIFEVIGKSIMRDSGVMNVVINSRDITERQKMEEELSKSQKLESVGILAGGIAHDFNNLLQAIMGNIALSKMFSDPAGKTYELLEKAEQASEQARDLSYRLLTFSKGGEPLRKIISLEKLLIESVTFALGGDNARIIPRFDFSDNLYGVKVDESQIKQVIANIVMNAKEVMHDGGNLTVQANNISAGSKDNPLLKEGKYLHFSITDQGPGIPEEYLTRIFDPYFSTKEMGTEKGQGLGLAICHSIVNKHEGLITVESRPGQGTTFHVYLPAVEQVPAATKEVGQLPGRRILFMDDEKRVRDIASQILESLGYGVELAISGEEAIEVFRKERESGRPFDAVILDLTVKDGMSGQEALRRLKEIDPAIKAIVSSGYADDPIMKDFKQYGFADAIAKPYTIEELQELLIKL